MCVRHALHASPDVITQYFNLGLAPEVVARYDITPGSKIVIVR